MKNLFFAAILLTSATSCNFLKYSNRGDLAAEHFKTEIPFEVEKDMAIVVPVGISDRGEKYRFHFDTHAPETAFNTYSNLAEHGNLKFLGESNLKVSTTSGEKMDRRYYQANSLYLGNVLVKSVSLLQAQGIKPDAADTIYPHFDGILGLSLLRKGVWKIDFKQRIITFASSIDSIPDIEDKVLFAKSDLFDIYSAEVSLSGLKKKTAIDLGANYGIILPLDDMKKLPDFERAERKDGTQKTAAGISTVTSYRLASEPVSVNGQSFHAKVAGVAGQTIPVMGLSFFTQFSYIVIDYPNGAFYIPAQQEKSL